MTTTPPHRSRQGTQPISLLPKSRHPPRGSSCTSTRASICLVSCSTTDLSATDSDLKILARMLNLNGQAGRNALPGFTAANFEITASAVPEPSNFFMIAGALGACYRLLRRRGVKAR